MQSLRDTVAIYDKISCLKAVDACIFLYLTLRNNHEVVPRVDAENVVRKYVQASREAMLKG